MTITISGCKKNDGGISVALESEVNEFIWQGMRTYYYWESEVPDLAPDRFTTFDELHTFLNEFSSPELLFEEFKVEKDRFSFMVSDYAVLDDALEGRSTSFGYEFRLLRIGESERIFGYVEYVLEGSPAENEGLLRGDMLTSQAPLTAQARLTSHAPHDFTDMLDFTNTLDFTGTL